MSRAQPLSARLHSQGTNGTYGSHPLSAPGTTSTTSARPMTPVGTYDVPDQAPPSTAPLGPSRQQRSELRHRLNHSASDRTSEASQDPYRDSMMTMNSDALGTAGDPPNGNLLLQNSLLSKTPVKDQTSPSSLQSALAAFQSAGSRRRQTVEEGDSSHFLQERERELDAERARQQRIRDKAPGLRSKATKVGEIDAVLEQVKDGWEFVIDPDFNHVDLALQLLDKSSVGKNIESFRKTTSMLSKVLRGSVDKHYQAFAASLPLHGSLLTHLDAVQTEVSSARSALHEAKESLGGVRADLVQVWSRGQVLEEMIKILDQIEYLKTVPDLLETLMSEKRLLQGSILLVRSLKMINNADLHEIGAVADLRSYLETQETALRDILIDELQSHLYLKSFWCESRWAPYVSGQQDCEYPSTLRRITVTLKSFWGEVPQVEFETNGGESMEEQLVPDSPPAKQNKVFRYLNNLNLRPNESPYDADDNGFAQGIVPSLSNSVFGVSNGATSLLSTNVNPEADSFVYMETLLESLAVLGKLGTALDTVAQRLPGEIFALFETTVDEVEERLEFVKCKSVSPLNERLENSEGVFLLGNNGPLSAVQESGPETSSSKSSTLRLSALESLATRVDHEILKDFFWTLYSKLVAVVQGFRVVSEVANRIGSRRDYKDILGTKPGTLFSLTEIWDQLQMEVRSLIQDYLVDEQQGSSASRNPISSINEILRDGKFNRERIKPVFRFADTDLKATNKTLKPHEDSLTRALKDTMPGLAPGAGGDPSQTIISSVTDERIIGGDQHHRLLIRPDAFHVTVLFQPTLSFLHRVADILPAEIQDSQTSSSVLDEFVLNVYLPQLEEKVLDIFHHAVTGPDAFIPDPISRQLSTEPIVKASIYLLALNNSLCAMLNTSPFHRENYSRLILAVVIQFYQKCSDRFHALTADPDSGITQEPRIALAAQWAQRTDFQTNLVELLNTDSVDRRKLQQIYCQETNLELKFMKGNTVTKRDLILSVKNLASLASLQRSVSWFMSELRALRSRSEEYPDVLSPATADTATVVTPSLPPLIPRPVSDLINLPLSREMGLRFQALLKTYEQLSTIILDTLRLDLRCRAIYYLDSSMLHGTYNSHYESTEPDPYIVDLNAELVQCDEFMAIHLPMKERKYVFAGLGYLAEQMLIADAKHLQRPTAFGIKKILRNILALQQVIKTLTDDVQESDFDRAKEYFSLFFLTPQEMLDGIRQKQSFTFEDYETMLTLQCSVDHEEAADHNDYSMYLLDLQCLGMERIGS